MNLAISATRTAALRPLWESFWSQQWIFSLTHMAYQRHASQQSNVTTFWGVSKYCKRKSFINWFQNYKKIYCVWDFVKVFESNHSVDYHKLKTSSVLSYLLDIVLKIDMLQLSLFFLASLLFLFKKDAILSLIFIKNLSINYSQSLQCQEITNLSKNYSWVNKVYRPIHCRRQKYHQLRTVKWIQNFLSLQNLVLVLPNQIQLMCQLPCMVFKNW